MSSCPNCLANNSIKKVYRDESVVEICEYCNTIIEESVKSETQIQNKTKDNNGALFTIYFFIIIGVIFAVVYFIDTLDDMTGMIITFIILLILIPLVIWAKYTEGQ